MSATNLFADSLVFNPITSQLVRAAGVPEDFSGGAHMLPTLIHCIEAAQHLWPNASFGDWRTAAKASQMQLHELASKNTTAAAKYFKTATDESLIYRVSSKWPTRHGLRELQKVDALLGRTLVVHAQSQTLVPRELVQSLWTLCNHAQAQSQGNRSEDWQKVIELEVLDSHSLEQLASRLGPKSPIRKFVQAALGILNTDIHPISPDKTCAISAEQTTNVETSLVDSGVRTVPPTAGSTASTGEPPSSFDNDTGNGHGADTTRVAARLADSDYAPPLAKLGIPHRDHLLLDDLVKLTTALVRDLDSDDQKTQGFAVLGLVSFITATSDTFALQMPLTPKAGHIWLDLVAGSWCWDFNAYRYTHSVAIENSTVRPNIIPLPLVLLQKLRAAAQKSMAPERVSDLIATIQREEAVDLERFREYLRGIGDAAHPPYRGRLAKSLAAAILELTGSDMLAALLTAQFVFVAAAALFYFGPSYQTIYAQLSKVYAILGLGEHSRPCLEEVRTGGHHIPSFEVVHSGWQNLVRNIDSARSAALATKTQAEAITGANHWMVLLCAAFVVQSAHRGTRLDQLTVGALASSATLFVLHDKAVDAPHDRSQPRLLGKTAAIETSVLSALECHALAAKVLGTGSSIQDPDTPIFCHFSMQEGERISPVSTRDVTKTIADHFDGAPANFARSLWVTELDADGCNRWLIRTLTGHTRDVTRTTGAYFDVPASAAASQLCEAMDKLTRRLFGNSTLTYPQQIALPRLWAPFENPHGDEQRSSKLFQFASNLLSPITAATLRATELAAQLRSTLLKGKVDLGTHALLLVHLLLVDLVPDPEIAMSAALNPATSFQHGTLRPTLKWNRKHFVHPVLLPLQAPTAHLLLGQQFEATSRHGLLHKLKPLADLIPCMDGSEMQQEMLWKVLCLASSCLRRLYLPPSLLAVSHPQVQSPCLNAGSLLRLAGASDAHSLTSPPPRLNRDITQKHAKSQDIRGLTSTLNHFADPTKRLGERRARATEAIKAIQDMNVKWTSAGLWLRDWVLEELSRSRDRAKHSYQLSSVSTYLSVLSNPAAFLAQTEPEEWDEVDWNAYLNAIQHGITGKWPTKKLELEDRVKHAAGAIVRSLARHASSIPPSVWSRLQLVNTTIGPVDSASSVLITDMDLAKAGQIAAVWLAEEPSVRLRLEIRCLLGAFVPMRSSEAGNLKRTCLTAAGGLVIERSGFNNIKNEQSIRVWLLSPEVHSSFLTLSDELACYTPHGDLLLRGTGADDEVDADLQAADYLNQALKAATLDKNARPHSLRGSTFQNLAWPNWQAQSRAFLLGRLTPETAHTWTKNCESNWISVAQASAAAGHAGIDSAIQNYLAGWPCVHALQAFSLLSRLETSPGYSKLLHLDDATWRKARSRASASGKTPVSRWGWYEQQQRPKRKLDRRSESQTRKVVLSARSDSSGSRATSAADPTSPRGSQTTYKSKLHYMALRSLGMPSERSLEVSKIPRSLTFALEADLPKTSLIAACTRRARDAPCERGVKADLVQLEGVRGEQLMEWITTLTPDLRESGMKLFVRIRGVHSEAPFSNRWQALVASLPDGLGLVVQKGPSHMSRDELLNPDQLPRVRFLPSRDLGQHPKVVVTPLKPNRVLQSRLTSLVRVLFLCAFHLDKKGTI